MTIVGTINFVEDNASQRVSPKCLKIHILPYRKFDDRPSWEIKIHGIERHRVGVICVPVNFGFVGFPFLDRIRWFFELLSHLWGDFSRRSYDQSLKKGRSWKAYMRSFFRITKGVMDFWIEFLGQLEESVMLIAGAVNEIAMENE
jgi:hypothetical protein